VFPLEGADGVRGKLLFSVTAILHQHVNTPSGNNEEFFSVKHDST
jgi:hypothetical protein